GRFASFAALSAYSTFPARTDRRSKAASNIPSTTWASPKPNSPAPNMVSGKANHATSATAAPTMATTVPVFIALTSGPASPTYPPDMPEDVGNPCRVSPAVRLAGRAVGPSSLRAYCPRLGLRQKQRCADGHRQDDADDGQRQGRRHRHEGREQHFRAHESQNERQAGPKEAQFAQG